MNEMNEVFVKRLRHAELIDAYRIIPRLGMFLITCAAFYLNIDTWIWFKALDLTGKDPLMIAAITAPPLSFVGAINGMYVKLWDIYLKGGRNWKEHPHNEILFRQPPK